MTDETKDVLRKFDGSIRYLYQDNRGPSAARNAGIRLARGKYICFLDADDVWTPNKLEAQLTFMEQHPDIGLVFSDETQISAEGDVRRSRLVEGGLYSDLVSQKPLQDAFGKLLIENCIPTSTVMVRRACFAKAGLFDESLRVVEDRDMWLHIAAYFGIACLPLILAKKREHQSNISANSELTLRSRIEVWNKVRCEFPSLASSSLVSALLADTHLELGYILLAKDQRKEARQAGIRSLTNGISHAVTGGAADKSLPPYRWSVAIGLLPLTFLRWSITGPLWQVMNGFLWKPKRKA